MKNFFSAALVLVLLMAACSKDDDKKFDFDGSLTSITEFVGADLLNEMTDMGLIIYSGNNPPNVEGRYLMSPAVLKASNVPNEPYPIGHRFADQEMEFKNQKGLDIEFHGEQATAGGTYTGAGSFISGDGDNFTVFLSILAKKEGREKEVEEIFVYSGRISPEGIHDIQLALFMVDNKGQSGVIDNGRGRLFIDEDGLAERLEGEPRLIFKGGPAFSQLN